MQETAQQELEQLRLQTKVLGLQRVIAALEGDVWSDVAKLGKDAYAAVVKEETSLGAARALKAQVIIAIGDNDLLKRFAQEEGFVGGRFLPGACDVAEGKHDDENQ